MIKKLFYSNEIVSNRGEEVALYFRDEKSTKRFIKHFYIQKESESSFPLGEKFASSLSYKHEPLPLPDVIKAIQSLLTKFMND